ncbi:hypothetical protein [Streptomyces cyaneus]|uniref:hypothetical protein n=1 Tax=Streptomyces cyaneus TaxID=1904 RepID=UPI003CCC7C36
MRSRARAISVNCCVRGRHAASRTQVPSDLVSTLLYVVDEGSGFLTGQTLSVSGGSAFL